jgi:hypothetical protein
MMKKLSLALLVAAAPAATGTAFAADGATLRIGVSGFVPVMCRATVQANVVTAKDGYADLGQLTEFCNSPRGYAVYADHSAELEDVSLIVDGKAVPLDAEGSTLISQSNEAAITQRSLALSTPAHASAGTITFRIVPL